MTQRNNAGRKLVSRRQLLKTTGTAALVAAAKSLVPGGANVAWAAGPETTKATLGYIALTDAAPLAIAKEKGLFAKHGLPDVEVVKQASWGALRDNIVLGSEANGIDGAHILTPMPYLISTGKVTQGNLPMPMYIVSRLNLDCQGISVGKEYADRCRDRGHHTRGHQIPKLNAANWGVGQQRRCPMRIRPAWRCVTLERRGARAGRNLPASLHNLQGLV